ncbi:Charged multivesicular body protein 6 [Thelohanellus kitauei]|uniref:Charged multivesicular body protein 6 n=1 Tax=Thelohanellus kitauei TaxID=669202 RepID=A0A0C2IH52_THEKT|nr:Charged multivesicular body protein 6 [Thelohanellus kitauei]
MGNIFKSKITQKDKAVLELKIQRDKLKRLQTRLEERLSLEKAKALGLYRNNQIERAKFYLKKKIHLERGIHSADEQINVLEKMITDLDFAEIQKKVFDGLKIGNECLKNIMDSIDLELMEEFQDTTEEARLKNEEINKLFASTLTEHDEEELNQELDAMLSDINTELPTAPKTSLPESSQIQKVSEKGKNFPNSEKLAQFE